MVFDPSPRAWVRGQVEAIEAAGTTEAADIMGLRVVVLTILKKNGHYRKVPLMRVEHDGTYAAVASQGGAPEHPTWYFRLKAEPRIQVQDGTEISDVVAREAEGAERAQWWDRCVAAYPPYAEYQVKTDRLIPVLLLETA